MILEDCIPLHPQDGKRIPVDPQETYVLEAEGGGIDCRSLTFDPNLGRQDPKGRRGLIPVPLQFGSMDRLFGATSDRSRPFRSNR